MIFSENFISEPINSRFSIHMEWDGYLDKPIYSIFDHRYGDHVASKGVNDSCFKSIMEYGKRMVKKS